MLPLLIEIKPDGEIEIEESKSNPLRQALTQYKVRIRNANGRPITRFNYTCPYCLEPFNFPEEAKACRDACYDRTQKLGALRNSVFIHHDPDNKDAFVVGRVLTAPDDSTVLTGVAKPCGPMRGPVQLLKETVTTELISF